MSGTHEWSVTIEAFGGHIVSFTVPSPITWYSSTNTTTVIQNDGTATACFKIIASVDFHDGVGYRQLPTVNATDYVKVNAGQQGTFTKAVTLDASNTPYNTTYWTGATMKVDIYPGIDIPAPTLCINEILWGTLFSTTANFNMQGVRAELCCYTGQTTGCVSCTSNSTYITGTVPANTSETIDTIYIKNTGNLAGNVTWKTYSNANHSGETQICTGTVTGLGVGSTSTAQVCTATTPGVGGTWYLGVKVYGGTEPEPAWTGMGLESSSMTGAIILVAVAGGILGLAYLFGRKKR
jgi:hypothetical protein